MNLEIVLKDTWVILDHILTIIGLLSLIVCTIRFLRDSGRDEWRNNIRIENHPNDFDPESAYLDPQVSKFYTPSPYSQVIVFLPVGETIHKLKVFSHHDTQFRLYRNKRTEEVFKNITPESPVCFCVERMELFPLLSVRWYVDYGEYAEYLFVDNLRNGITEKDGVNYKKTFITKFRKAVGWK